MMSRMALLVEEPETPLEIRLNYPFFYYLEDINQNIFFVGRYTGKT